MTNSTDSPGRDEEVPEEPSSTTPLLRPDQKNSKHSNSSSADHADQQSSQDEWDSSQNSDNPRNWPTWYKWITVVLVSFIEFLTTMPNFMYAPNISDAQKDLDTSDDTLATFSLTIYLLGFGLGPLLFAPLSELYGRAIIYRSCLAVFLAMTAGCALSSNISLLVAFRFLVGGFGAAPVAIGGAVVGDLFPVSQRGTAMSIYQAGLIISAVIGPPAGGLIGFYLTWRWVFWIVCIMAAFALLCTLIVLQETHAPTLKRALYGSNTSNSNTTRKSLVAELSQALSRPLKLLTKSPVVFSCCLLIFLVIGTLNVFLTLMSRIFQKNYHMSSSESGSVYLGLASGFAIASATFGATNDRIMNRLTKRNKGEWRPEFRLPAAMVGMPLVVVGLLWYGWSLELGSSWIVPVVGSGVAGIGLTTIQLSITTYLVDSFDTYSASALAAITMARSLGGALVPLLGPLLYKDLGLGWGNSVFAFVNLAFCGIPVLLFVFGARWRGWFSMEGF